MGKYSGTLHRLVESACTADSRKKWDQVLFYLENHTVVNSKAIPPDFESPLPPNMVASVELECELFDRQGPQRDDTPLKIAVTGGGPMNVVAALCHLGPEAAQMTDGRQRLPLHWACRRSSDDKQTDKVIMVLANCHPEALLHRDDGGRTPLHWLFWYHAKSRSSLIVQFLAQEMPHDLFTNLKQPKPTDSFDEDFPLPTIPRPSSEGTTTTKNIIPRSAAIVYDSRHGALPLHYAVMQGTSKEALKALIHEYPASIALGDRRGRSPLAWYLGAGYLIDDDVNTKHVSGERNDPNAPPWWHTKLSLQSIQALVSSKVARMEDDLGRTTLHWACHFFAKSYSSSSSVRSNGGSSSVSSPTTSGPCISIKIFQILLDHNVEAVTMKDTSGQTPLHTLFAAVADIQDAEQQRLVTNRALRETIDLIRGGPAAFDPPKQLLELLLKSPDVDGSMDYYEDEKISAAHVEDDFGLLPLHLALRVATTADCVQQLIQSNPTSLVHTSEELMQTPLIHAFCTEYSAPLQPVETLDRLMAAYVTSRHGTFMDGRLALKMEDATGMYPIHYACQNQSSFECLKLLVERFNRCAIFPNADGDLPVHSLLSQTDLFGPSESGYVRGATLSQGDVGQIHLGDNEIERRAQIVEVQKRKMMLLLEPLTLPEHLKVGSFAHGMTPLHIAIAFEALSYERIYRMVDTYPEALRMVTTQEGHNYSCLDLHDRLRYRTDDPDRWHGVREMLYAFHPLLEGHRRDEELLDACVRLIRSEVTGRRKSFHIEQAEKFNIKGPVDIDLNETLSAIHVPEESRPEKGNRRRRQPRTVPSQQSSGSSPSKKDVQSIQSFASMLSMNKDKHSKKDKKSGPSIYDADLDSRYVVSPQHSLDDDDGVDQFDESDSEGETSSGDGGESTVGNLESSSWGEPQISPSVGENYVSLTLSQTFNCGPSMSLTVPESASLLRKAISDGVLEEASAPAPADILEEKKEDAPPEDNVRGFELSEIALKLWSFFVAYNNLKDPDDNYLQQVESVLEDMEFDIVERLIDLAVPECASKYLVVGGAPPAGLTMRDVACPKVKALFESYSYFLGRFEFPTDVDNGALLHRSGNGNTVWIRATEHVVATTEYQPPKTFDPGAAEAAIWDTGEMVHDEEGYMASKFRDKRRPVCFKLTRSQFVFDNEVKCRSEVGMEVGQESTRHILPFLCHFNCLSDEKMDKRYRLDVKDERFRVLPLYGGESICLSDFPFALVYPWCEEGDLFDYFYHIGIADMHEITHIAMQIGRALKMMHDKGVVLRNLSMRSITMLPFDPDTQNPHREWVVSDLSSACRKNQTAFMGGVSSDGTAQFETGLMPPEMFVKLSSAEADVYRAYWQSVENIYKIKVEKHVAEPFLDSQTGSTYVVRCHYAADGREQSESFKLPELPYKQVPSRESTDLWCFGLILFIFCSGGRPLFPTNMKTGHLLEHEGIVNWDKDAMEAKIYEHISDPVAQDLLLQLLAPYEDRSYLSIDKILFHPFFSGEGGTSKKLGKLIEQRQNDSAAYLRRRSKAANDKYENDWLQYRTIHVHCWNFDMLRTFHFSSSEIIRKLACHKENVMPSSFLLIPYKLSSKNKKSKLAPTTKKDVERAERMGVLLLSLAKSCHFAARLEEALDNAGSAKKWDAAKLLEAVSLSSGDFETLKEEFSKIAADRIEEFRSDPMTAVLKLVEGRFIEIKSFFKDSGKCFLYLVDEHKSVPLVGPSYEPYPIEISESAMSKFLPKVLPSMHCCSMVARGVSGSASGIVRLIFEAAYPHVPPSWAKAATGLTHVLDEGLIKREVMLLHRTLSGLNASKARKSFADDLWSIRDACSKMDVRLDFAGMKRVYCAGESLWTTEEGTKEIQEACKAFDFQEALEIQAALETKVKSQEQLIKQLNDKVEWLSFRKEYNIRLPQEHSYSSHSGTQKSDSTSTHSGMQKIDQTGINSSISVSTHSGTERMEAIAPSISVSSSNSTPQLGGGGNADPQTTNTSRTSRYSGGSPQNSKQAGGDHPSSTISEHTELQSSPTQGGAPPPEEGVQQESVELNYHHGDDYAFYNANVESSKSNSTTDSIEDDTIPNARVPHVLPNDESSVVTVRTKTSSVYRDAPCVD